MIMNATNGLRGLSIRALGRTGRRPEEDERKDAMWWMINRVGGSSSTPCEVNGNGSCEMVSFFSIFDRC